MPSMTYFASSADIFEPHYFPSAIEEITLALSFKYQEQAEEAIPSLVDLSHGGRMPSDSFPN